MYDKCVFRYTAPVEQFGTVEGTTDPHWALAMTHTDDTDMIGTSMEVLKAIKAKDAAKYKIETVDPSYMLGVRRLVQVSRSARGRRG